MSVSPYVGGLIRVPLARRQDPEREPVGRAPRRRVEDPVLQQGIQGRAPEIQNRDAQLLYSKKVGSTPKQRKG